VIGSAVQGADSSIGQSGQRVAQQFAFLVHTRNYSVFAGD
jgi:ketosteroid isomerase-like protein